MTRDTPRRHWIRHPTTRGALTHTAVVGIVVALVSGLRLALPAASDTILAVGGLVLAGLGFAGLYFTFGNGNDD